MVFRIAFYLNQCGHLNGKGGCRTLQHSLCRSRTIILGGRSRSGIKSKMGFMGKWEELEFLLEQRKLKEDLVASSRSWVILLRVDTTKLYLVAERSLTREHKFKMIDKQLRTFRKAFMLQSNAWKGGRSRLNNNLYKGSHEIRRWRGCGERAGVHYKILEWWAQWLLLRCIIRILFFDSILTFLKEKVCFCWRHFKAKS